MVAFTVFKHISGKLPIQHSEYLKDFPATFPCVKAANDYSDDNKVKGKYFVCGTCSDERHADNIPTYSLLSLDIDQGLNGNPPSDPQLVSEALEKLRINHWIYTSFSHMKTPADIKYRVVMELSEPILPHDLRGNLTSAFDMLTAQGIQVDRASENKSWSQAWFLPRTPKPEHFKQWLYTDGSPFPAEITDIKDAPPEPEKEECTEEAKTLHDMFKQILKGDVMHPNILNLTMQLARDGVSKPIVMAMMTAVMETSADAGTKRWMERFDKIEKVVDGAYVRAESEQAIDDDEYQYDDLSPADDLITQPPFPYPNDGGRLDRTIKAVYDSMPDQCMQMAYVQTMLTYATMIGASMNAYSNQLSAINLAFIVVADSGVGKAGLSFFPHFVFREKMGINRPEGFLSCSLDKYLGSSSQSNARVLHNAGFEWRHRLIIDTESAKSMATRAGMPEAILGYRLTHFIEADNKRWATVGGVMSPKPEDAPVNGFNFSFLSESNPDDMGKALQGEKITNGYLNRHSTFKVADGEVHNNTTVRDPKAVKISLDEDVIAQIDTIMSASIKIGDGSVGIGDDDYVIAMLSPKCLLDYNKLKADMIKVARETSDKVTEVMARRIAHKAIKFAAVKSHIDHWDGSYEVYTIKEEDWEWGKKAAMYEMNTIPYHMSFLDSANSNEQADELIFLGIAREFCSGKTSKVQRDSKTIKRSGVLEKITKKLGVLCPIMFSPEEFLDVRLKKQQGMGNLTIGAGHKDFKGRNTQVITLKPEGFRRMISMARKGNVKIDRFL